MKFSLVAALVVVLALAHGSQSAESPEIEKLKEVFADLTAKTQEFAGQAQTMLASGSTQMEPLAAQIQEHVKPLVAATGTMLEELFRKLTMAINNQ